MLDNQRRSEFTQRIGLPKEAFDEEGELVKYIFWKVDDVPEGKYMTEEYPEDSHIHFWVGDDPADAPSVFTCQSWIDLPTIL